MDSRRPRKAPFGSGVALRGVNFFSFFGRFFLSRNDFPKPSLSRRKVLKRTPKAFRVKVRPQAIRKVELRVRTLPEEKVAKPLLPSGPNQQIHISSRQNSMIHFIEQPPELIRAEALN